VGPAVIKAVGELRVVALGHDHGIGGEEKRIAYRIDRLTRVTGIVRQPDDSRLPPHHGRLRLGQSGSYNGQSREELDATVQNYLQAKASRPKAEAKVQDAKVIQG
jgi:hypothetical protein